MYNLVFILLWCVDVLMKVIGIVWDVVKYEVNLTFWYKRKQCKQLPKSGYRLSLSKLPSVIFSFWWYGPLGNYSFGNLTLSVFVRPSLPPWLTLNVNLESVLITIMSKGGKLKRNIILELYFVSSRNTYDPGPLDVPFACNHARLVVSRWQPPIGARFMTLSAPPLPEQMPL
jgi:hypothetical protein